MPGKVKTRLIKALGETAAACLANRMLEKTLAEASAASVGPVVLMTDPGPRHPVWNQVRPIVETLTAQGKGDLGERLGRAARKALEKGDKLLLIGTDCPQLDRRRLKEAAIRLEDHDGVILPAADGGYVLLGLRRFDSSLFEGIAWSSSSVARETIARIERLGWSLHVGETLSDVDEPADLEFVLDLLPEPMEFSPARPTLRSILPVAFLGLLLAGLAAAAIARPGSVSALGLAGLALLVAGGSWLLLRNRFPGAPRLRVDRTGMSYERGGKTRNLSWDEVAAIKVDHQREDMRFVPVSGEAAIVMNRDMVSVDGQRFDMLMENYWLPRTFERG